MSDYMTEGYYESLATQEKMESIGGKDAIIAKAMMLLGVQEVPSYFMPQQGAFLPDLGAFRAFTLLTEGKEALLRHVLCPSRCGEASKEELVELVGCDAMVHLDEVVLQSHKIADVLEAGSRRLEEVSALGSAWRRTRCGEDRSAWDRAAAASNALFLEEHLTATRCVVVRDEEWQKMVQKMVEVMK